jgi:hypothetical protein
MEARLADPAILIARAAAVMQKVSVVFFHELGTTEFAMIVVPIL